MTTLLEKIHEADEAINRAVDAVRAAWHFSDKLIKAHLVNVHTALDKATGQLNEAWIKAGGDR